MKKNLLLLFILGIFIGISACKKDATCTDGKQNQGELGIDCCGPCTPCTALPSCNPLNGNILPTCSDGVQNGDETGIDCGGTDCPACTVAETSSMTALVNGAAWTASSIEATVSGNQLIIVGTAADGKKVSLTYTGNFAATSVLLGTAFSATYGTDITDLCVATAGSISITTFNTSTKKVSGAFLFNCTNDQTGDASVVSSGVLENISYQ
ncbi:MAG: DUF6252 family protein [Chitinophagales bacterium]|nr:hypothetical protein [Bacteroidota bacterium]MCB9042797.1 hypothetical protein [Chitinophagales bacterium]